MCSRNFLAEMEKHAHSVLPTGHGYGSSMVTAEWLLGVAASTSWNLWLDSAWKPQFLTTFLTVFEYNEIHWCRLAGIASMCFCEWVLLPSVPVCFLKGERPKHIGKKMACSEPAEPRVSSKKSLQFLEASKGIKTMDMLTRQLREEGPAQAMRWKPQRVPHLNWIF